MAVSRMSEVENVNAAVGDDEGRCEANEANDFRLRVREREQVLAVDAESRCRRSDKGVEVAAVALTGVEGGAVEAAVVAVELRLPGVDGAGGCSSNLTAAIVSATYCQLSFAQRSLLRLQLHVSTGRNLLLLPFRFLSYHRHRDHLRPWTRTDAI